MTPSEKCYFAKTNAINLCSKEFILSDLPQNLGELNAISEYESI